MAKSFHIVLHACARAWCFVWLKSMQAEVLRVSGICHYMGIIARITLTDGDRHSVN